MQARAAVNQAARVATGDYLALGRTHAARRTAYLHLFARPLIKSLRLRRLDLVHGPFIGDRAWVTIRLEACGLSPPG